MDNELITFEYGAMSSKFSIQAKDKLVAYAAMIAHYGRNSHIIALYEPDEIVKSDSWLNIYGKVSKRLDEMYGGEGSFDKFIYTHLDEIKECMNTIKRLI